jgi:hypothetical protein
LLVFYIMAESELSLLPGLPDTGQNEAIWWVRFTEDEKNPKEHPVALYVADSDAGLIANRTAEPLVIEEGATYVTTTNQKYAYSFEIEGTTIPMRTGYVVGEEEAKSSGLLGRKTTSVPAQLCGVTIPPREWAWPPVQLEHDFEKPEYELIKDRIAESYEPGQVITDRDIKQDVYDVRRFGHDSADQWWSESGLEFFTYSDLIEQCDSTGRRWRVTDSSS